MKIDSKNTNDFIKIWFIKPTEIAVDLCIYEILSDIEDPSIGKDQLKITFAFCYTIIQHANKA